MKKTFTPALLIVALITLLTSGSVFARGGEFSFFLGPSIDQSGNIEDLGNPEANTGFEFNYFLNEHHGLGVSIGSEYDFEGGPKFPRIIDASIQTWDIHYALRLRPQNSMVQFTFTPGFGMQTLYDASADYYWGYWYYNSLSTAWVFDYKLMVDFILKENKSETGVSSSSIFVGLGVQQIFSMNDDYQGRDISGNRLSGLFRIGFGF